MQKCCDVSNLICFKVYSASRAIIRLYNSELKKLNITYPQYLVLVYLYSKGQSTINKIGEKLYLDSGTLTPLLKRMEKHNLVIRKRSEQDERNVNIHLTEEALRIKEQVEVVTTNFQTKCREMCGENNNNYEVVKTFLDTIVKKI